MINYNKFVETLKGRLIQRNPNGKKKPKETSTKSEQMSNLD
jgi:hypothetical protein